MCIQTSSKVKKRKCINDKCFMLFFHTYLKMLNARLPFFDNACDFHLCPNVCVTKKQGSGHGILNFLNRLHGSQNIVLTLPKYNIFRLQQKAKSQTRQIWMVLILTSSAVKNEISWPALEKLIPLSHIHTASGTIPILMIFSPHMWHAYLIFFHS